MQRSLYPFNLSLSISFYIDVHKYICTHFHIYIISTMYYISICALYFHRRCRMCSWRTSTIFIHIPNVSKQDLYIMYIHLSYHLHRHCGWCWWSTWACLPASCSTLRSGTGCKNYSEFEKRTFVKMTPQKDTIRSHIMYHLANQRYLNPEIRWFRAFKFKV